jgi:MFS family permease
MDTNQIILAMCSFTLGVMGKYADLVNEHGLKEHFKGAGILSGYLWGLSGLGMLVSSPLGGLTYVAHVLYWFWRVKLEYPNHALAGVIMILSAFFFRGEFLQSHKWDLIAIFLAYLISGYIQTYFKDNFPNQAKFWRLRLRIYLIPLIYALYTKSWDPLIATGFGMIGCEWITIKYKAYWEDLRKKHAQT